MGVFLLAGGKILRFFFNLIGQLIFTHFCARGLFSFREFFFFCFFIREEKYSQWKSALRYLTLYLHLPISSGKLIVTNLENPKFQLINGLFDSQDKYQNNDIINIIYWSNYNIILKYQTEINKNNFFQWFKKKGEAWFRIYKSNFNIEMDLRIWPVILFCKPVQNKKVVSIIKVVSIT